MSETVETFSKDEIISAIGQWLEYGEQSYVDSKIFGAPGHCGYYNGGGWAARCLRYHLSELKKEENLASKKTKTGEDMSMNLKSGEMAMFWSDHEGFAIHGTLKADLGDKYQRRYVVDVGINHCGQHVARFFSFAKPIPKQAPDLKVDANVFVFNGGRAARAHFHEFRDGMICCFAGGKTSWSSDGTTVDWPEYSLDGKTWYRASDHEEVK